MLSEDQEYLKWAFEYVEDNYEQLVKLTGSVMRNPYDERITDAMSFIMLRNLPNVLKTWNPEIGDLDKHVHKSWKWYVWKYLGRADLHRKRENLLTEAHEKCASYTDFDFALHEQVSVLQQQLPPHYWMLLRKRFMEGCTISEIADHCCLSRSTIKSRLNTAIEHAQKILKAKS